MLHTLEWEYVPDYELLGISSSVGCHRLAWAMNRAFDWHLKADVDVLGGSRPRQDDCPPFDAIRGR